VYRVGGGDAYAASGFFLLLGEGSPLWTLVHHLFVEDEAAASADSLASIVIVNKVGASALWALVHEPFLCLHGFSSMGCSGECSVTRGFFISGFFRIGVCPSGLVVLKT